MKRIICIVFLLILCGLSISANATLVDNGNGTVTQYRVDGTILMWLTDASSFTGTWADSVAWANTLEYAGYNDLAATWQQLGVRLDY